MNFVKGAIIFIGGAATGAVIMKVIMDKIHNKEIEEIKEEESEVREYYIEKIQKIEDTKTEKEESSNEEFIKPKDTIVFSKDSKTDKIDYTDIKEAATEMLAENEVPEEDLPQDPYVITEEEFNNDHPEYEKISLEYYEDDGVIAEDSEAIVDIDGSIGYDAIAEFADNDNLNELYIRNNALATDFEITRVYGSYNENFHFNS